MNLFSLLKLDKPCRLPDSGMPVIQTGSTVMDFVLISFDEHKMAVGESVMIIGSLQ